MTSFLTELVHSFFRIQVWDFLAVLKTHWWPSLVFCSLVESCLFDTFPISILNLSNHLDYCERTAHISNMLCLIVTDTLYDNDFQNCAKA